MEAYRPLLDLCRLLADSLAPGEAAGTTPGPAFLLDMERVFEQYITHEVVRALVRDNRHTVSVQPLLTVTEPVPGQPDLTIRPDILIDRGGCVLAVVDAKWKRPADLLLPADLYQVLAYATTLGAGRAVLVYPGRRDRVWRYALPRAAVAVEVRTLRVIGPRDACARSLTRLGRAIRRSVFRPASPEQLA